MQTLPLEVRQYIATLDEDTWYLMFKYDEEFAKSTMNEGMRKRFVNLFTKVHTVFKYYTLIQGCDTKQENKYINEDDDSADEDGYAVYKIERRLLGKLHSEDDDNPAVRHTTNINYWYKGGQLHRDDDKPAIESDDRLEWYENGKLHRKNDEPARITRQEEAWYKHGKLHRDDDKPALIKHQKVLFWYKNGKLHRENDKPAIISTILSGAKQWRINGLLHRENNKPAIEYSNELLMWFYEGIAYRSDIGPVIIESNDFKTNPSRDRLIYNMINMQ